jgi:hypothetical protein
MTEKFFPDPGIEIPTPSFQKKRGFASLQETLAYIRATIKDDPLATRTVIGKTRGGKEIPAVILRREDGKRKTRVLLLARIHGDEPAGTEALLYFLHRVFSDSDTRALLDHLDIALLPFINIDGGEKLRRELDGGLDMNRDMTKLLAPETVALNRFATAFSPDIVLDLHEYRPFRADYARLASFGACAAPDVMLLHSDNLNRAPALGLLLEQAFLPSIHRALSDAGMTSHLYFTSRREGGEIVLNLGGASPRSSSTSFALRGAISILAEIRGADIGRTAFKRRVLSAYLVLETLLRDAVEQATALHDAIAANNQDSIVVTATRPVARRPFPFIDIEKNARVDIDLPARAAADAIPVIVRSRPLAYAIAPGNDHLVEKLDALGVITRRLDREQRVDGETFLVSACRRADTPFEGIVEQTVTTSIVPRALLLPPGSALVEMNQRAANLAAMLLEPEAENSFTRYGLVTAIAGQELPLYRITGNIP